MINNTGKASLDEIPRQRHGEDLKYTERTKEIKNKIVCVCAFVSLCMWVCVLSSVYLRERERERERERDKLEIIRQTARQSGRQTNSRQFNHSE